MSATVILFGTESGNAELVADDLIDVIGSDASALDMSDFDIGDFTSDTFYLVVCSTHGEGELPSSAKPFSTALQAKSPDLGGIRYAIFGLGNSSYDNYSHGSEIIDEQLTALGASRIGEYGRHDAADGSLPNDEAIIWLNGVLQAVS